MSKVIKVAIRDRNTLELQEDGHKGDLIELNSIHEKDISTDNLQHIIESIKNNEFERRLQKEVQTQLENKIRIQRNEQQDEIAKLHEKIAVQNEREQTLKALHQQDLKNLEHQKDAYIKELKNHYEHNRELALKANIKLTGESLEQHCFEEYERHGHDLWPNAKFYKDNVSVENTKGDYIYKDFDGENEILSIMFEMKNEREDTDQKNKKKNSDFYEKLDKDRKKKNCQYAVLVSMLEQDKEIYNDIFKVHEYEKMYVIRPSQFLLIIKLLHEGLAQVRECKLALQKMQNQEIDLHNFESNIENVKEEFNKNYLRAKSNFEKAINEIDESIKKLQKTKEDLLKSENQLRLANDKINDVSVRKLTKNAPSILEKIKKHS